MSDTTRFREGTASDRDAILALRALVFPDAGTERLQPAFWEWEMREGYAGKKRFFVAEADDRIVGNFALVPQDYFATAPLPGALGVDVMTHPEFRRRKILSRLAAFARDSVREEAPLITGFQMRKAVQGGIFSAGWRPIQQVPLFFKPLSLRWIAGDLGLPAGAPASVSSRPEARGDGGSIRPILDSELQQIDPLLLTDAIRQRRSPEFVRWRYRGNPSWRYEILGFFDGGELRAFVIHRDTTLRGFHALAIADMGTRQGDRTSLPHLIRHVCSAARRRGLGLAATLLSRNHPASPFLRRSGFLPGFHRFNLVLNVMGEALAWTNAAPWSLSWGDTDHL